MLGVIGGHSILDVGDTQRAAGPTGRGVLRPGAGPVAALDGVDCVVLQRHGLGEYVPAHLIDHACNLRVLTEAGCDRVLALSSVGSLRADLGVGTHVVPDDFIALGQPVTSVYTDDRCHVVPGFTPEWRTRVLDAWRRADDGPVVDGGVYWQARGPRFETPAEIRLMAGFADVVGMTVGSECTVANELGLEYAAVCVVDNVANGLDAGLLTPERFAAGKHANEERLLGVVAAVARELAG